MKLDATNPEWLKRERRGWKQGKHSLIHLSNGDYYEGLWKDDMKHGKGIYYHVKTGSVYEGSFENDMKGGYGTLSVPIDPPAPKKSYDSEFDKPKHRGHVFEPPAPSKLRKIYIGEWMNDERNGHGTAYYLNGDVYEGEWKDNQKEGWGKQYYATGQIYEGEWHEGKRHGQGIFVNVNGDRYEGTWVNDLKEGPGRFIYIVKRQMYEGEWSGDVAKCGTIIQFPNAQPEHPFPQIQLKDWVDVLAERRKELENERHARVIEF